ncbi:hypothetical protein ACH4GE_24220 [Streptomyces tendae]|uniref:hypothetical protein n=1 Tax=Streptomyces tendae TaxID=1932 RepID=UPI0037AD3EA7
MYTVVAFAQGRLRAEVGGDGTGLTAYEATHFARELREEFPGEIVAILPARKSWLGGWPYN